MASKKKIGVVMEMMNSAEVYSVFDVENLKPVALLHSCNLLRTSCNCHYHLNTLEGVGNGKVVNEERCFHRLSDYRRYTIDNNGKQ